MPELIFFDTFSHDGIDSITANMDLVQFPSPVRVTEIRIIPLGARVEAKFPNGDRLGATNPSSFEVSFCVNDLSRPGASTFADIGNLSYRQNVSIVLTPRIVVPTDGLLIKGDYQTLTIAVLGETKDIPPIKTEQVTSEEPNVAQISSENQGVILSPSKINQEPQSPTATDEASQGAFSERSPSDKASVTGPADESFVERESTRSDLRCPSLDDLSSPSRLSPSSVTRSSLPSPSPLPTDGEESNLVRKDYEKEKYPLPPPVNPDLLESISPDASPVPAEDSLDAEAISDDELPELPPTEEAEEALEDISSDDDDVGTNEDKMEEGEGFIDSVVDDAPHHLIFFDPSKDSIEGLDSTFDPCLVTASLDQEEAMTALRYLGEFIDDRDKFLSSLTKFVTAKNQETREEEKEYIIATVIQILDSIISTKPRGRNVRQTKGILTLVRILLSGPWNLRIKLLEEKIVSRLLVLFDKGFVAKPPSLRLRILDCLDVIMDFNYGMEFCLLKPHSTETNQTIYQWILEKIMEKPSTRVLVGLTALLKKCHFFESLTLLSRLSDEPSPGTEKVKALLSQITFKTHHAHKFMHQPLRHLPASSIWERKYDDLVDTTLFKWSQGCHLLPACLKILKNESLKESHSLVLKLVERISQLREGSIFLLTGSRISVINEIIELTSAHQNSRLPSLASSIAWKLHAISLICHLNQLSKREHISRLDNSFEQKVYRLFMLLFTDEGKTALFQAASDDSILRMLIQIPTLRRAQEVKIVQDTLIQVIVQAVLSRQDPVHMFKLCGSRLSRISRDSNNLLLTQFIDTVTPISRIDFTSPDYFALLCRTLRREFDIIKDSSHSSSIQLLTLTRVMREVSHDPVDHEKLRDPRELKYDFALFHLYSNNGLEQLFSVIDHISKNYCNPYLRLFQSEESKFITIESLASSISIIHSILKKLISLRGANFSDISGVPILLRSLAIDDSFFDDTFLKSRIQKVKDQILETLHLYTRFTWSASPNSQSSGVVEAGKSLWVKMLRELLSLTISSPNWFTAGVSALDFLLPEPLPILIESEERQKEAEKLLAMRKIWSAHLQHVNEGIENLVAALCCSSTPEVVSGLRKICIKLSELPVTPGVSCCMGFLKIWPSIKDKSAELLNWLHLVSSLISHPSFRITFLFTLFHSNKEVYEGVIPSIFDLLNNTNEDVVIRTADILAKLCDPRIQIEKKSSCSDSERKLQDLADTLPPLHFLKRVAIGLQPASRDSEERPRDFLCAPKTEKVTASWTQLSNILIVVLEALVSAESHGVISAELTKKSQLFAEVSDVESLLPRPRPLAVIFEDRLVVKVLTKADETEEVLLTTSISGQRADIDLLPIANSINGFTLSRELESLLSDELHGTKRKRSDLDSSAGHHHQQPFNSKRLAITPVVRTARGRGISAGMSLGSRVNDPFRSRPPNTSRPPSMHVDDFVALEHRDPGVKGKHQPKRLGGAPIAPQPNPKNWTRLRRT